MKLIYCPHCHDVRKLATDPYPPTFCACSKSYGTYATDGLHAVIGGAAVALGFSNKSLVQALNYHDAEPKISHTFEAFVIPSPCKTVKRMKDDQKDKAKQ